MTSTSQSKSVKVMVQFQDTKLTKRLDKKPTMESSSSNFKHQVINSNRYSNTTTTKYLVPIYTVALLGTLTAGVALLVLQKTFIAIGVFGISVLLLLGGMSVCCTNIMKVRATEKKKMLNKIEMSHQVSQTQRKTPIVPPPDRIMMRGITSFTYHGKDECEACLFHRQCEEIRINGNPEFIPPSIGCMELTRNVGKRNNPANGHVIQKESPYLLHLKNQSEMDDLVRHKLLEHDGMKKFIDQRVAVEQYPRRRFLPKTPKNQSKIYKQISLSANDIEGMKHEDRRHNASLSNDNDAITRDDCNVMLERKPRRDHHKEYSTHRNQTKKRKKANDKDELAIVDVYPDPSDNLQSKRKNLKVPSRSDLRMSQSSNASIEYIVDLTSEDSDDHNHDKNNLIVEESQKSRHNGLTNNNIKRKADKSKISTRKNVLESYIDDFERNKFQSDTFAKV